MMESSSKISCDNMRTLAMEETRKNFNMMKHILGKPTVSYVIPGPCEEAEDIVHKELDLLKGFKIDKYSCIYKRPNYNEGPWVNQFRKILPAELENQYNITTKAKLKQLLKN